MSELPQHPNGMRFESLDQAGQRLDFWEVYSIGGGALLEVGEELSDNRIYSLESMQSILKYCTQSGLTFWEYVQEVEGAGDLALPG